MTQLLLLLCAAAGEKDAEDKDVNSEAPSSPSEATSEKDANSVSQSNAVSSKKEEEPNNSIKKVISWNSLCFFLLLPTGGRYSLNFKVKKIYKFFMVSFYTNNLLLAASLGIFWMSHVTFWLEWVTTFWEVLLPPTFKTGYWGTSAVYVSRPTMMKWPRCPRPQRQQTPPTSQRHLTKTTRR